MRKLVSETLPDRCWCAPFLYTNAGSVTRCEASPASSSIFHRFYPSMNFCNSKSIFVSVSKTQRHKNFRVINAQDLTRDITPIAIFSLNHT